MWEDAGTDVAVPPPHIGPAARRDVPAEYRVKGRGGLGRDGGRRRRRRRETGEAVQYTERAQNRDASVEAISGYGRAFGSLG